MALKPVNQNTATFEDMEDEGNFAPAAAPATTPAPTTAVAVARPAAVTAFNAVVDTVSSLKDAMPVTYDMLISLIATNGNICKRDGKKPVGDEVVFELISWQDSYVVSPGDDKAPKDMIRYSDDGVVCSDGSLVQEHLSELRSLGYTKAAVKQRAVVVGSVINASKTKELDDELVQFDLSPQSRTSFKNYAASVMNKQRLGKITAAQATKVKASAVLATMNGNTFTKVEFSVA
jgi:hypothetical protein